MTYDRFVRDRTFCDLTEYAQAAYVPSLETPACFVGYRLFKFVLGIFGFILGALAASSIWGASDFSDSSVALALWSLSL